MNEKKQFPWARFMRAGMGELGLSPTEFWRSTPREISRALGPAPPQPMLRQNLISLMDLFPDDQQPE